MAAHIEGAGDLLEIGPCGGREACGEGVLGQQRSAQGGQTSIRCGFVGGTVIVDCFDRGDLDAEVCDNLIGRATAVARLQRRLWLDVSGWLPCIARALFPRSRTNEMILCQGERTSGLMVGFFLNMAGSGAVVAVGPFVDAFRDFSNTGQGPGGARLR